MYFGPLNIHIVVILFAFGIPCGILELSEYMHNRRAETFPIKRGTIIQRERTHRFGIPAGRLTIQMDGIQQTVIAITNSSAAKVMPNQVQFHYTGNPADEVFLESEENSFLAAVFLLAGPFVALGIWLRFRGRPGMEGTVE